MATAHAHSQPVRLVHALGHGVAQLATGVADFFVLSNRATVAAAEYERLSHLSDQELAALGLERSDIGRAGGQRL